MDARTVVTFRSGAFNTTEKRDYFINPECYGDDLCRWLIERLSAAGLEVESEPGQEDFGWYMRFTVGGTRYCFVAGHRPGDGDEAGEWVGWVERDVGFLRSIVGGRNRRIDRAGPAAVHAVLQEAPEVAEVRWHRKHDFDAGREHDGAPEP